jgi:hypothetical protein
MCIVLLPPGVNPIAVNKCIITNTLATTNKVVSCGQGIGCVVIAAVCDNHVRWQNVLMKLDCRSTAIHTGYS